MHCDLGTYAHAHLPVSPGIGTNQAPKEQETAAAETDEEGCC